MNSRLLLAASALALFPLGTQAAPLGLRSHAPQATLPLHLAQIDVDPRDASQLPLPELQQRIQVLRNLAANNLSVNGVPAKQLLQADMAELERRRGPQTEPQQQQPQQAEEQRPAEEAAEPQQQEPEQAERPRRRPSEEAAEPPQQQEPEQAERPRRRPTEEAAEPQQQPEQAERPRRRPEGNDPVVAEPKRPEKPPRPIVEEPRRERPADDLAVLRDERPATALTDAQLRRRIRAATELAESDAIDRRQERRLRTMAEADTEELNRRILSTTGADIGDVDVNREARRLLDDNRPARRLRDAELRDRITQVRGVLALSGLGERFVGPLRDKLSDDREELRSRVAEVERPRFEPGQQKFDRRDLRRRLVESRDERRRRFDDPEFQIVIPRGRVSRQPLPTITLAEAYDADLERQLAAPPSQPINRRYTMQEYRANPGLRTLMPGVEVDTVKFGFNEDFLREEEIYKLDRVAEILERIVAGNPDEVFLIEGHTDLVGSDSYNEALSYRRAAAVRDALTQYYNLSPRNLEIAGYGEQFPRIPTEFEEPENRRVTVRRITPILYGSR